MKRIISLIALMTVVCTAWTAPKLSQWVSTTSKSPWVIMSAKLVDADTTHPYITINSTATEQGIEGFGGCFNEMGWDALGKLSKEDKNAILKMLFDPDEGCKFNLCRMPIGANDYSMDWYSYDETDGDFALDKFSIVRDKQRLIPYIHEAQMLNNSLRIWASPWCPPSWMKVNKNYACHAAPVNNLTPDKEGKEMVDQFVMEDKYLKTYALYFSKFINAYRKEGIKIEAVHVQNEPNSCQVFPSCVWTPGSLGRFIAEYLGPQFEKDNLKTQIWLGTIERSQLDRVEKALNYKGAKKYISGIGFQWAGKGVIPIIHAKYPEMKLMQTETECGDGSNNWGAAIHTWGLMKHYFENGANAYMYWNMVLDETGLSYWGWKQNSMISINPDSKSYRLNPEFYLMKHFSSYIGQGAKKLKTSMPSANCLSFKNEDSIIIVYYNAGESNELTIKIDKKLLRVKLPAESFNTFKINL